MVSPGNEPAVTARRMGPKDTATPSLLLDAVDSILRDQGYAAVTLRRVADHAGVKPQLIYYYFQSMDELLLAAFHRRTVLALESLRQMLSSDTPLRAIWASSLDAVDARLSFEYMAIANQHEGIAQEIAAYTREERRLIVEATARQLQRRQLAPDWLSPAALAILMKSISLVLVRERDTGIDAAHSDVLRLVDEFLSLVDGTPIASS